MAYAFPDRRSYNKMAEVVRRHSGLENDQQDQRRAPRAGEMRLAKVVTSTITSGTTGSCQLQKDDWTDSVEDEITVQNDHLIDLPVGTQMYVQPIQGKWRVVIPFIYCEDTEPGTGS